MKITGIYVYVTNNNTVINYIVICEDGTKELYNEFSVPHSIVHKMNASRPKTRTEYNHGKDYCIKYTY